MTSPSGSVPPYAGEPGRGTSHEEVRSEHKLVTVSERKRRWWTFSTVTLVLLVALFLSLWLAGVANPPRVLAVPGPTVTKTKLVPQPGPTVTQTITVTPSPSVVPIEPTPTEAPTPSATVGPVDPALVCQEQHQTSEVHVGLEHGPEAAFSMWCGPGPHTQANELNIVAYCGTADLQVAYDLDDASSWQCVA